MSELSLDLGWVVSGTVIATLLPGPDDVDDGPAALVTDEDGLRAFVVGIDTSESDYGPDWVRLTPTGRRLQLLATGLVMVNGEESDWLGRSATSVTDAAPRTRVVMILEAARAAGVGVPVTVPMPEPPYVAP